MSHSDKKVAFLITTYIRDKLLFRSVESLLPYLKSNWIILIGDQGESSVEKSKWFLDLKTKFNEQIHLRELPSNCGLSYARNRLVELAKEKNCEYCVLSADSIEFNESISDLEFIISQMNKENYNLIGINLLNRISWEGWLTLKEKESFELEFIYTEEKMKKLFTDCSCVRNFFVATTNSLSLSKWDEELKLGEHEDWMFRYAQNYKMGCTTFINGNYIGKEIVNEKYNRLRRKNFQEGIQKLLTKYKIQSWIIYKNQSEKI